MYFHFHPKLHWRALLLPTSYFGLPSNIIRHGPMTPTPKPNKPGVRICNNSKHQRAAYRHIAATHTAPLVALPLDDGRFATGAADIDSLLIDKWSTVYQGNVSNQHEAVQSYLAKYSCYLFRSFCCLRWNPWSCKML